jgi:hypothetical protein
VSESAKFVAVVVDPEYGDRLDALALEMPIWVADTPTNRVAAETIWRRARSTDSHTARGAVTTFRVHQSDSPSDWALSVLGDINLHHGEYSQTPPDNILVIIGAEPTPDLRKALVEYGLSKFESRTGGFRASALGVA